MLQLLKSQAVKVRIEHCGQSPLNSHLFPLKQKVIVSIEKNGGFICRFREKDYLCTRKIKTEAPLAQLVEQLTLNQWVQGSNP